MESDAQFPLGWFHKLHFRKKEWPDITGKPLLVAPFPGAYSFFYFFLLVQLAKRLGQDVFKSSQSRAVFRETDGPPKVKKLLSCGERPGGLFTSPSRKAGMCAGRINTTHHRGMPRMNRVTGSEPGSERHRPAPGRLRELVTHIGKCSQTWKVTPWVEAIRIRT